MEGVIIYFASFESAGGKYDRFTRYKGDVVIPDFLDWIQERRKEIEIKCGNATVINCKVIKP